VASVCPECSSSLIWRDGKRQVKDREVQRFICRSCGFRFSEKRTYFEIEINVMGKVLKQSNPGKDLSQSNVLQGDSSIQPFRKNLSFKRSENISSHNSSKVTNVEKDLNTFRDYNSEHQVCVSEGESKNLVKVEQLSDKSAGFTEQSKVEPKETIFKFKWWLKKQGYAESTIASRSKLLKIMMKRGAKLSDPESIKEVIAKQKWSQGRKENAVYTYSSYLKKVGGKWEAPRYKRIKKIPWIPTETEVDQLIAGCSKKVATFLQLLKETGMRPGEAWCLKWIDFDFNKKSVRVTPEKGSNPRILKISSKLIAMLKMLPQKNEFVFKTRRLDYFADGFRQQRKRIAHKLKNPQLTRITFRTLRHFKATMEYHKTKDILHVMRILGHKSIKNTLVYTHLIDFGNDEYVSKIAQTAKEAKILVETGFEYICTTPENFMLFRKKT
jgi:integrase